jgi:tetratricopeptide (TPR) repeat protein
MEYLASLKAMNRDSIYALLNTGLQGNLRKMGGGYDVLSSLRPQMEDMAGEIHSKGLRLYKEREQLRSHLSEKTRQGYSVYRAEMEASFANKKLSESLVLKTSQAHNNVLTAEHMLKDALRVNHRDYRVHFELGWTYLFLLDQQEQAEFHLACATKIAIEEGNHHFAIFAKRHLADVHYSLGRYDEATASALNIIRAAKETDNEYLYECARYMAAAGDVKTATHRLAALVAQSPVYYVKAQVEPDFTQHDRIREMLHDLRQVRVKRIQHYVHTSWQNHELSRTPLPDMIDPNSLFMQTFRKHVRVMSQLPYGTLAHREQQIGKLVVQDSQKRIMKEIHQRSRQYESISELKRRRWSWINKAGGMCIHASVVLLLASLMFFAARYLASGLGFSALLSADMLLNYIISVGLLLMAVGAGLIQFVPLGSKKLLRKQIELDNTLKLLNAPQ